jgi:hypothetical protein
MGRFIKILPKCWHAATLPLRYEVFGKMILCVGRILKEEQKDGSI